MVQKEEVVATNKNYKLPDDYLPFANEVLPFTIEESVGTFYSVWDIESWSSLEATADATEEKKIKGPSFKTDQYEWNVVLYPKGNQPSAGNYVSLYLLSCQEDQQQEICAQVALCIVNPIDPHRFAFQVCQHRFNQQDNDWGFTLFSKINELKGDNDDGDFQKPLPSSASTPFIVEDRIRIIAIVRLMKDPTGVLWHNFMNYDSKAMTGYVGLHNQGATCYMNSLFQSLFFTNLYRKAVYQVPTENDDPNHSIVFAFQRLFYRLQFSTEAVSTLELTKSFGWNTYDSFMQHDVQEFNRLLQDHIENKMRNTPAQYAIKQLFVGRMKSYIKCLNVDFESSRSEDFYDIQLNVKGCKSLEESFCNYVLEETLEGDNKYMAEGHGLQDAKKGVIFESFPPVLHLQLKRFEYDMMKDTMVKINDRHEFPAEINLAPYLSVKENDYHNYVLHGVLVHTGNLTGGHYFAFVRPTKENQWFKFDDDRVTPASLHEVFEDNFGGQTQYTHPKLRNIQRPTNAYMLVYLRQSYQDEVLAPVTQADIPTHLIDRIKQEDEEREAREKQRAQQHLYMTTYIVTERSFQVNQGPGFIPQEADENIICKRRVKKSQTLDKFMEEYAEEYELDPYFIRVWTLCDRQNGTTRLNQAFEYEQHELTLQEVCQKSSRLPVLRLYIEQVDVDPDTTEPFFSDEEIENLIFLKVFDPLTQSLRSLGSLAVLKANTISSMKDEFCAMAQLVPRINIDIYEEVEDDDVQLLNQNQSFDEAELVNGDILIIQPILTNQQKEALIQIRSSADITDYLYRLQHSLDIIFAPSNQPQNEITLCLREDCPYDEVVFHLAACIQCACPENILLRVPDGRSIQPIDGLRLSDIQQLMPELQRDWPKLYYDVLPVPLAELKWKKLIRIFRLDTQCLMSRIVPRIAKVSDLYPLVVLEEERDKHVRIYQVMYQKVTKILEPAEIVDSCIPDGECLFAEILTEQEVNKGPDDYYISVFHYEKELTQIHSFPFQLLVIKDEDFNEFKRRLQVKSKLNDEAMEQVGIVLITAFSTITLNQDNYQKLLFEKYYQKEVQLGLNHVDPNARYTRTVHQSGIHFNV